MRKGYLLAAPLALAGAAWFYWLVLPWPITLRWTNPPSTAFMQLRAAQANGNDEPFEIRHEWVPLDRISRHLRRAVIVAEDGNFYDHRGVDWQALREELRYRGDDEFSWLDASDVRALRDAIRYYLDNREKIRGRSTITQQLAKNLYFSENRSALRKVEELIVARRLEALLAKERILELYLNFAEWGPGVFGAEAAARHYYDRSAADLTRDQAAALAATLPHPLTSNPRTRPARMAWRKQLILQRMPGAGPARTVPLEPIEIQPTLDSIVIPPVDLSTTILPDTLRPDTLRPDSVAPPDTLRPDTLRRDTLRRDTLRRVTLRRDTLSST